MLPRIRPMRLRALKQPFDDPDYIFELKHDGFRAVVYIENRECKLVSRNMRLLKFDSLKNTLAGLPVRDAVIDGEIVCLDKRGVSQFNQLLFRRGQPVLYAFDLLWHDGEDLRPAHADPAEAATTSTGTQEPLPAHSVRSASRIRREVAVLRNLRTGPRGNRVRAARWNLSRRCRRLAEGQKPEIFSGRRQA